MSCGSSHSLAVLSEYALELFLTRCSSTYVSVIDTYLHAAKCLAARHLRCTRSHTQFAFHAMMHVRSPQVVTSWLLGGAEKMAS